MESWLRRGVDFLILFLVGKIVIDYNNCYKGFFNYFVMGNDLGDVVLEGSRSGFKLTRGSEILVKVEASRKSDSCYNVFVETNGHKGSFEFETLGGGNIGMFCYGIARRAVEDMNISYCDETGCGNKDNPHYKEANSSYDAWKILSS